MRPFGHDFPYILTMIPGLGRRARSLYSNHPSGPVHVPAMSCTGGGVGLSTHWVPALALQLWFFLGKIRISLKCWWLESTMDIYIYISVIIPLCNSVTYHYNITITYYNHHVPSLNQKITWCLSLLLFMVTFRQSWLAGNHPFPTDDFPRKLNIHFVQGFPDEKKYVARYDWDMKSWDYDWDMKSWDRIGLIWWLKVLDFW